ncbi:MAG: tripartite tricarboxylate transporter substrate binding protein [Comamonadaceae bacterium]|jgi:tripartite-type tricarboxylate transporter receptor subunit TctC|uniref:Bug family tripartite tricarboxylate transporter substrate binding protein n=1 Tax=Candidatus Skiveiella danica TaxID=3386177 RepID=UPI001B4BFDDA|nr:tripartite tricarboxylate transporter substrate binding protein [Comamonadaceae bacterium]MBK9198318.1 tripartite tricarboxylate transporter substrate binding protein [Betaproteobacteria bacterium]MBP8101521.1 tripartite tricarboxylate transporter substrate binding protein [Burkholderiaceae bacterium]HQD14373.1 tripartite tricarboxylate transporter substrate binding protein [Ottowia sp.]MBK6558675.1 tripartite tricarboxylate transporter substrate binding protein [Comamonadaceae bacterium]
MPVTSRRSAFILVVARVVPLAALVFAVVLPATSALAQGAVWPNKPVKIVVTFPPGGAPDTLARILADKWGQSLGQTFTVDNKPGAGGNIGADFVAKSAGDGTTLVIGTVGTHAINPALYAVMPYNHVKDFTPVSFLASTPNLLVVNNKVPATNVKELIELARKQPLNFGSSGSGTSIHLSGELFNTMAGVKMQHLPYKGRAQAVPDLLGGRIEMIFDNMPSALPLVKAGEVRAIGVTSAARSPAAPNIPTIAEKGLPGFEATSWFALLAPAGLPRDVQLRISAETARVLALPDVKEKLTTLGLDPSPGTPEALAALIQVETVKWAKVVKESGAKPD